RPQRPPTPPKPALTCTNRGDATRGRLAVPSTSGGTLGTLRGTLACSQRPPTAPPLTCGNTRGGTLGRWGTLKCSHSPDRTSARASSAASPPSATARTGTLAAPNADPRRRHEHTRHQRRHVRRGLRPRPHRR